MLLRLSYWGKMIQMDGNRWVKKVYEEGRARLAADERANTWCNLTRKWLMELGLQSEWQQQAVGPAWQEKLRTMIEDFEARNWRRRIVTNAKLDQYVKWKAKPEMEQYLNHENVHQRRLWIKMRGGCLELRVETGRWERVSMGGKQVRVPRHLRKCKLCYGELEDAHHVLFRCPAYLRQRVAMAAQVRADAPSAVAEGMRQVTQGGNSIDNEMVVMKWLMRGGGHEVGMEMLEGVMQQRLASD